MYPKYQRRNRQVTPFSRKPTTTIICSNDPPKFEPSMRKKIMMLNKNWYMKEQSMNVHELKNVLVPPFVNINLSLHVQQKKVMLRITNTIENNDEKIPLVINFINDFHLADDVRTFIYGKIIKNQHYLPIDGYWETSLDVEFVFDDETNDYQL